MSHPDLNAKLLYRCELKTAHQLELHILKQGLAYSLWLVPTGQNTWHPKSKQAYLLNTQLEWQKVSHAERQNLSFQLPEMWPAITLQEVGAVMQTQADWHRHQLNAWHKVLQELTGQRFTTYHHDTPYGRFPAHSSLVCLEIADIMQRYLKPTLQDRCNGYFAKLSVRLRQQPEAQRLSSERIEELCHSPEARCIADYCSALLAEHLERLRGLDV